MLQYFFRLRKSVNSMILINIIESIFNITSKARSLEFNNVD